MAEQLKTLYFSTSALQGTNVEELFGAAAKAALGKKEQFDA